MRRPVVGLLLLCAAATAAPADEPHLDARDIHYRVTGATAAEILADLRRQARNAGRDYFAEAIWRVDWKYDYDRPARNLCRAKNLRLYVTQRTTLPHWDGGGPPELVAQWQDFMRAVRLHEKGHTDHGAQAAQAIRDAVLPLSAGDCAALAARINQTGLSITRKFADLDARYDAETEHGIRQGAYWEVRPAPVAAGAAPRSRPGSVPARAPATGPLPRPELEPLPRPELEAMPRPELEHAPRR